MSGWSGSFTTVVNWIKDSASTRDKLVAELRGDQIIK